jgi:RHS repeat-associated protein
MGGGKRTTAVAVTVVSCLVALGIPAATSLEQERPPSLATEALQSVSATGSTHPRRTAQGSSAITRGIPHRSALRAMVTSPMGAGEASRSTKRLRNVSPATLDINPGNVTTFAGNGVNATLDGIGTAAEFKDMGGAVVVGNYAYVATAGAIRRVDLTTADVITLAGSPTATGCVASDDPTAVRFSATPGGIDSDGTYLYMGDKGCGYKIWKTTIATGATSALATVTGISVPSVVYASDGYLYTSGTSWIVRVDPSTGATTNWVQVSAYGLAADPTYLWAADTYSCHLPCYTQLARIEFATMQVTILPAPNGGSMTSDGQLVSAGDYLYAENYDGTIVERIAKADGSIVNVAGTSAAGYANGTGTDAWFQKLTGLASDGTNLWGTDSGNHRLRKIVADSPLPASLTPNAGTTVDIYPGKVSTFAGSGADATTDGYGTAAAFQEMGGAVVVGNYTYVATSGSIRRVDLTTTYVDTLAGSDLEIGCVASPDPDAVRLGDVSSGVVGGITSDGYYLYTVDGYCDNTVWRTSIATGATSKIAVIGRGTYDPPLYGITYAPNGYLYVVGPGPDLLQVDPINGTSSTFVAIDGYGVAADADYLWVSGISGCYNPCKTEIDRIDLVTGEVITFAAPNSGSMTGTGQLVSAGGYLYTTSYNDNGIERITKFNGAVGMLAGGVPGQAEGEWSNAQFSKAAGVAFDGSSLWIADSGTHLFSKAVFVSLQAQEMGAGDSADASAPQVAIGDPVITNPGSGAFTWSATDATLPGPGLLPLAFTRYYSSRNGNASNRFGSGWSDSYDATVEIESTGNARVTMPNGQALQFTGNGGVYTRAAGIYDLLVFNTSNYVLTQPDGTKFEFEPSMEPLITPGWRWRLHTITDRVGNITTLTYSPVDDTLVQVSAGGQSISLGYTDTTVQLNLLPNGVADGRNVLYTLSGPGGQIASVRDLNGNTWTYSYQGFQLSQIKDPYNQAIVTNTYGSDGRIAAQQDAGLPASTYDYSTCGGNCTKVTDGRGHVSVYQYSLDGQGILTGVTDQDLYATSFTNPDLNHNPQRVTDPRNNQWQYTYDLGTGSVTSVISPGGSGNASYSYNSHNEVTQITDARGKITRFVYDGTGNLQCRILPPSTATTCPADPQRTINYSEYSTGQLLSVITPNDGASNPGGTTTYTYWPDGMVKTITRPRPGGTVDPVTSYSDVSYDSLCQCQTVTMVTPQGNANNCGSSCAAYTWTYKYDNSGHLTKTIDPLSNTTIHQFDNSGRLNSITDPRLKVTTFNYVSGSNRLQSLLAPYGTGATATTTYFYDGNGNLQCEVLPTAGLRSSCTSDIAHTASYTYTNDNRLSSATDPDGSIWSLDYSTWLSQGKVTESVPGGGTITRTSDADNRVTNVDYSDTTADVSFSYALWMTQGKVSMSDGVPGGSVTYTYDPLNNLTGVKRGTAAGFTYAYFPDGRISSRTYPDATATSYSYFADGSLNTASSGGKTTTFAYDLANAKATKSLPNAMVGTSTFDTAGRLTNLTNKKNATTYSSFAITPDAVGNPATVVATIKDAATGMPKIENQTYTYDDGERLQKVCFLAADCSGTGVAGYSWTYDGVGNRLTQAAYGSSPGTTYYKYDGANHLCWAGPTSGTNCTPTPNNDTAYVYNARGDMTAAGSVTYGYDLANRLTNVTNGSTTDSYTYDGASNRLTNLHNGSTTTTFAWDINASIPLLATDSDSSTRDYIYGDGLLFEKIGTARYYYSNDGFGSVANVTDANAGLKLSYWYDPYGGTRALSQNSPPPNFFQFDTEYHDSTGAYNLRARIYQPGLGAFQQADPATGNHVGYHFASDRPTVLADPSGLFSWGKVFDWFNRHINPAYGYLQGCFGSDGSGSLGSWAGRCAIGSTVLAVTAVALAGPVGRLVTRLGGAARAEAGGVGPVLRGQAGVERSIAAAEARGESVVGREITMETTAGRTRPDLLVRDAEGNLKFIESKNGQFARLTPNQTSGFPLLESEGGIPRGLRAWEAGLTPGEMTGPIPVQIDWWGL